MDKSAKSSNAALAIQCFDQIKDIIECIAEAHETIQNGKAKSAFRKLLDTPS